MDYARLRRKLMVILFFAQSSGSAAIIAIATVNPIIGAQLSGSASMAGAPSSTFLVGSALAALFWGYSMDRLGRRGALVIGLVIGCVGITIAAIALTSNVFIPYLVGLLLIGMAQSALLLSRFAAAEVHPPQQRGRAISNVVLGGAVGAVLGPLLVAPTGRLALQFGFEEMVGPFFAGFLLFLLAGISIFVGLRPDPRDLAKEISRIYPDAKDHAGPPRPISVIFRHPGPLIALASMSLGQMVMVLLMVITALHMRDHHHALISVSVVISSHTFGMFAFSVLSGRLADHFGREPVILIGAGTLILACLSATVSPQVVPLAIALFLLGLGWNFCYVAGSSLLSDQLAQEERARTQGFNDLTIGIISASGSLGSGIIYSFLGYNVIAYIGALVSLFLLGLVIWWQLRRNRVTLSSDQPV
jgi:MFS family permease